MLLYILTVIKSLATCVVATFATKSSTSQMKFPFQVSLYYDDFELQTLVYRAPEVS